MVVVVEVGGGAVGGVVFLRLSIRGIMVPHY